MTPCIKIAEEAGIFYRIHEYTHDPSFQSYGFEAADKLGVPQKRVFKTLIVDLGNKGLAVAIVPVSCRLSMKLVAKAAGTKRAGMAKAPDVTRSTGYVFGGVSPLGQKRRLPTLIDSSAKKYSTIFVSAGRRGLQIELRPQDLEKLTNGRYAQISC